MLPIRQLSEAMPFKRLPRDEQGLVLTGAVVSCGEEILKPGYSITEYVDKSKARIPVIMVACNAHLIMDLFFDLVDKLGEEVSVVLETSHNSTDGSHEDLYVYDVDSIVLKSHLADEHFEELVLRDGYTGIAVHDGKTNEIQLSEDKTIVIYSHDLSKFESVLKFYGLKHRQGMKFVTNFKHEHDTFLGGYDRFCELRDLLGAEPWAK